MRMDAQNLVAAAAVSIFGILVLGVTIVALAVKGRGDRTLSFRGFGVSFEMRPCTQCQEKGNTNVG